MSQSDYIKFKKTSNSLKTQKFPPVFSSGRYSSFKTFNLENTIQNSKLTFNLLKPASKQIVFGMEKNVVNCPTFPLCTNTNLRTNRVALSGSQISPRPYRPLAEKQHEVAITQLETCLCSKI